MQYRKDHKFTFSQKKAFVRFRRAAKYGTFSDHMDRSQSKPVCKPFNGQ